MRQAKLNDPQIRGALRKRVLRHQRNVDDLLVIDELGLAHARSRVDLAVFNGHLHGYEIKSAQDTLTRLPQQLETYSKSLQKLTLVVASAHLESAASSSPQWCGIIEVRRGSRGAVRMISHRRATLNPDLDPFVFAHLLWKPEAQDVLRAKGYAEKELYRPRKELYRLIVDECKQSELAGIIKLAMVRRTSWRDHSQPL